MNEGVGSWSKVGTNLFSYKNHDNTSANNSQSLFGHDCFIRKTEVLLMHGH